MCAQQSDPGEHTQHPTCLASALCAAVVLLCTGRDAAGGRTRQQAALCCVVYKHRVCARYAQCCGIRAHCYANCTRSSRCALCRRRQRQQHQQQHQHDWQHTASGGAKPDGALNRVVLGAACLPVGRSLGCPYRGLRPQLDEGHSRCNDATGQACLGLCCCWR
jgi:hypothetical protein